MSGAAGQLVAAPARYHLSVDDVFAALIEAADAGVAPFDHPFFAFLQGLHDEFGAHVDLYLFAEGAVNGRARRLEEVPDAFGARLAAASWLRLGPHALDDATRPYDQSPDEFRSLLARLYGQIDRLVGPDRRARWVRLHYFSECYEAAPSLCERGVEALLLTDKPDVSYRLDDGARQELAQCGAARHCGLTLRRSFTRIEQMVREGWDEATTVSGLRQRLEEHGYVALFTHEADAADPQVRAQVRRCLAALRNLEAAPI
jgi:hypothetical protein